MLRAGIVGLPNVGKSTLFNALTRTRKAEVANYPFCTIEPNVGIVPIPDPRVEELARIAGSANIVYNDLKIVDIAGLVRGASMGEGLGNQFLANIRETDAILHVVRCFRDDNVVHVDGSVDPERDIDVIETELLLADLDTLNRRIEKSSKLARAGQKDAQKLVAALEFALKVVDAGKPIRTVEMSSDDRKVIDELNLLTSKPVLYVANVSDDDLSGESNAAKSVQRISAERRGEVVVLAGDLEAQIARLEPEDRGDFLVEMGLEEPGLNVLVRKAYRLLDLETLFTSGPKESRAWTVQRGAKAPQAAGKIHSDFERGFIRAETVSFDDMVACGGEQGARSAGKMRSEGKDYVVQDGDVILFRFNV